MPPSWVLLVRHTKCSAKIEIMQDKRLPSSRRTFLRQSLQAAGASTAFAQMPYAAHAAWPPATAAQWLKRTGWLAGCNFIPSNAVNQLEMWQADSFELATIERELGWAEALGFNSVRVFLHDLLWQDREAFLARVDQFLTVAHRHKIGVLFVLFDGVWNPQPQLGKQAPPRPHVHNPGWLQSPGAAILGAPQRHNSLQAYVRGVVGAFRNDNRVHGWDIFNEPNNANKKSYAKREIHDKEARAMDLLRAAFGWAKAARPTQPLTAGLWNGDWSNDAALRPLQKLMVAESDVISFHSYDPPKRLEEKIFQLRRYGRPLLCTEFMARGQQSTFDPSLEILKRNNVAAYCWGFVSGKTQTIYPWDSWTRTYTDPPDVWFHDILHPDGRPYDPNEVAYIKRLTGAAAPDRAVP